MQRSSTHQTLKPFADLPTASGGLSRLAANRLRRADIKLEPLLSHVGLTVDQINDPERRIDAHNQIAFLEIAAAALNDQFLGFSLAEEFDCRDLGLLYDRTCIIFTCLGKSCRPVSKRDTRTIARMQNSICCRSAWRGMPE